jgi:hypothetical protein
MNPQTLITAVDSFVSRLNDDHQVPGQVYETLLGVAHWAREGKPLTNKQITYVKKNIVEYSDQLDYLK